MATQTTPIRPRRPTRNIPPLPVPQNNDSDVQAPNTDTADHDLSDASALLTPLRAHYLKKSLIQLQFGHELDGITSSTAGNVSTLSYLGSPFLPPPRDAPRLDLPFLRYIFRQFVLTFPFMAAAPKDFYSEKLQPFVASVLARNLSPDSILDDGEGLEKASRLKLLAKIERNLSLFVGSGTKLVEPEEVVRLKQSDLDRLETLANKRLARQAKHKDIFEVNIVSVRAVTDKGRMRSRVHEEFIIRTRRSHQSDVFVSRRYGDFKTLANELRKNHPDEIIRPPPAKDRTMVTTGSSMTAPPPSFSATGRPLPNGDNNSTDSIPYSPSAPLGPSRLAREKNRLTLRSYLHSLMSTSAIASSPVLKSFLLSGPTSLSPDELEDARRREEADKVREDGRKRFAREIAGRVEGLRDAVKSVKGDIMGKDGLTHIFATVKTTPDIRGLPSNYQAVLEWARISLASTVFQHFVAADNASETFAGLKRIHGLMPYFMLKAALKISNPMGMIRGVLDLFMAQPFGGRSLLQRMFTSSLTEEVKALEEDIEAVRDKVDDPVMCEKMRQFVYAPREIQEMFKADAAAEKLNVLTVVLRASDEPRLTRPQIHRVMRAHNAHSMYLKHRESLADSDDDDGPEDDDAWLFEDLKVLTQLYSRLRDREQLIALIFEGVTAELLKDIITIFYAPLAQVYRAASIADSLSDLQNFVNDLIKTVEAVEELSQEDPQRTVQTFIDLIQRHEQAFYSFVHKVHSKGEDLFDSLMRWIELFLTVVREGLGDPVSLEFLLPHTGKERTDILSEVDAVALYHYKLKVAYEDKVRRRFGKIKGGNDADAEDEATQALVQGVVGEISFGDLVQGDAVDLAAEETDESDASSTEYETDSESDESEDSSEQHAISARPIARAQTVVQSPRHTPQKETHPRRQQTMNDEVAPRQRSISLRSSKSMTFSLSGKSSRHNRDLPPLPPLPNLPVSLVSKPLLSSPIASPSKSRQQPSVDHHHLSTPKPRREPSPTRQHKGKSKKAPEALKPPDLHHIPKLLPVFTEMMRPLLRPRSN